MRLGNVLSRRSAPCLSAQSPCDSPLPLSRQSSSLPSPPSLPRLLARQTSLERRSSCKPLSSKPLRTLEICSSSRSKFSEALISLSLGESRTDYASSYEKTGIDALLTLASTSTTTPTRNRAGKTLLTSSFPHSPAPLLLSRMFMPSLVRATASCTTG